MCGIAGWFANGCAEPALVETTCAAMTATLAHRGPDGDGIWLDSSAGLALGHRRLAILDLSEAGRQPMASATGRYCVTYNGEIYNHLDLRHDLDARGEVRWRGHSDTETLLAGFEAWGVADTLTRLSGMFAIGIWDRERRELTLARDRMGEKPLFYAVRGRQVWFASELKALRGRPGLDLEIDRDAAGLFFRFDCVPAPFTIYRDVFKLPPGTFLTLGHDAGPEAAPRPYWSLRSVADLGRGDARSDGRTLDEAAGELDGLLGRIVRSQMLSDAPLGAFLSGGVDSSLITALMAGSGGPKVKTFAIGFGDSRFNEAVHARAVAHHLGTDHAELVATEDHALAVIPRLATVFDEPFSDSSQIPTVLLSELARSRVTVAMSGDGGDELFGGYNRYLMAPRLWDRFASLPRPLRRAVAEIAARLPAGRDSLSGRGLSALSGAVGLYPGFPAKVSRYGDMLRSADSFADLYRGLVQNWPADTRLVLAGRPASTLQDRDGDWPALGSREETMMAVDALTYLPDDILVKVDRSAMASSLETRAPFLDREIVEFACRLPLPLKIAGGRGKQVLRRVLDRYVPRELIERPKQGFAVPIDDWLRGRLRGWAEELLSETRLAGGGLLDPKPIRAAWRDHVAGRRQLGSRLWSVLMFQAWLETQ